MSITETIKNHIPNSKFIRSVSILAGGTTLGQAVLILGSPLLTRLYSPEDFGLLAVYAALAAIIAVISTLRYPFAIPLPNSDLAAAEIAILCLLILLTTSLLTTLTIAVFGIEIATFLQSPKLQHHLWLLPIGILALGSHQVFNYWAIRKAQFRTIANAKWLQPTTTTSLQLAMSPLGPVSLLLGQVLGQSAGSAILLKTLPKIKLSFNLKRLFWAAKRYKRFPTYSTPEGVMSVTGRQLPTLLLATFFGGPIAGMYLLTQRILTLPITLIGRSTSQVFFSHGVQANQSGKLDQLILSVHQTLAKAALPPTLIIIASGPELFSLIFGQNWEQAGTISQWLAPSVYMMFITSPLSALFAITEKQNHLFTFQIILISARALALLVGAYLGSAIFAIAAFSITSALIYGFLLLWIGQITKIPKLTITNATIKPLPLAATTALPLAYFSINTENLFLTLMVPVLLTVMILSIYYYFSFKHNFQNKT